MIRNGPGVQKLGPCFIALILLRYLDENFPILELYTEEFLEQRAVSESAVLHLLTIFDMLDDFRRTDAAHLRRRAAIFKLEYYFNDHWSEFVHKVKIVNHRIAMPLNVAINSLAKSEIT